MHKGISIWTQPDHTEVVTDFDEAFRVCRAQNSKNSDKKIFLNIFCFDRDKLKILKTAKIEVSWKSNFSKMAHE